MWAGRADDASGCTASSGEESRQTLYTMLTRGRAENHVHVVLADVAEDHALPSPTLDRKATATELLEGILARDGAAVSATTARAVAAPPEAQLQDAVTRYADALALAAPKVRADLVEDLQDLSLIADALRDASWRRTLDLDRLRDLLAPLAERNGFRKDDGRALLDRLMQIAWSRRVMTAPRVRAASPGTR